MLRRLLSVAPVVALACACDSPTIPLPPPEAPSISPGVDADHVKLTATCNYPERNAVIVIINSNQSIPDDEAAAATLASACGAWDAQIFAHSGDQLIITYQLDSSEISLPLYLVVP